MTKVDPSKQGEHHQGSPKPKLPQKVLSATALILGARRVVRKIVIARIEFDPTSPREVCGAFMHAETNISILREIVRNVPELDILVQAVDMVQDKDLKRTLLRIRQETAEAAREAQRRGNDSRGRFGSSHASVRKGNEKYVYPA